MATNLERELERKLLECYAIAKREFGYRPTRFLQTLRRYGGVLSVQEFLGRLQAHDTKK